MKLPVVNATGKEVRTVDVDDSVFGIKPNGAVLHQVFVTQRANQRLGIAKTKTRGEVQGSTRKVRPQKGTGRARQGTNRAPHRVGGGIAWGPRPHSYAKQLNKKMRRLAIRSALSGKVADGQLVVIDQLAFERPKTQEIVRILNAVGISRSALVVTSEPDRTMLASVRNLDKTKVLPAAYLNVADMMNHAGVLITEDAVRVAERLWGQNGKTTATAPGSRATLQAPAKPARKPAAKKPEPEAEATAEEPEATKAVAEEAAPAAEAAPEKPATRRRAAPKAEAAEKEAPKPRRAAKPKTEAKADEPAEAPKPRRRTTKKTEGEG